MFIDTHCHIHDSEFYDAEREKIYRQAIESGVSSLICVGTSIKSSTEALSFASTHPNTYASIGVHPHDTRDGWEEIKYLATDNQIDGKLVAIGEIGLDYFYEHSPHHTQLEALEAQLQIAVSRNLPVIFHVRDAFDDFWSVFDNFSGLKGVLHSFTDTQANLDKGFERGLYVGVNGISTFTKDSAQQQMYANIPVDRMLLETDAPFLAPHSHRGKTNQPAYIADVAAFHANLRGISASQLADVTTANAKRLFQLEKFDQIS